MFLCVKISADTPKVVGATANNGRVDAKDHERLPEAKAEVRIPCLLCFQMLILITARCAVVYGGTSFDTFCEIITTDFDLIYTNE